MTPATLTVTVDAEAFAARFNELMNESEFRDLPSDTKKAEAIGISKALYSQWKNARTRQPDYGLAKEVCRRLGANVDYLLENQPPKYLSLSVREAARSTYETEFTSTEPRPPKEEGVMNLQQHKAAMLELMENISSAKRQEWLEKIAQDALERGDIKRRPDWMLTPEWSAANKIAEIAMKTKKKPGRHDN